jgi:ABC-type nitrate/sulfonate/bicarbonate transport system permease component
VSISSSSLPASRRLRAPAVSGFSFRRVFGRIGYVNKVSIATSLALLLLWQLAASLEVVPAMFLPSPFAVATKLVSVSRDGFQDATLLEHLLASVGRVTAALIAAVISASCWVSP